MSLIQSMIMDEARRRDVGAMGEFAVSGDAVFEIVSGAYNYVYPLPTSLAGAIKEDVDTMLVPGLTMATNGKVYSTQDHATPNYVRNTNLWCADYAQQLTCASPWNSQNAHLKAGTAITPQHIVLARHYQVAIGTSFRFIGLDGTVYTRSVIGKATDSRYSWPQYDLTVYTLDSPLPAAITPAKILPADWEDQFDYLSYNRPPLVMFDQEEKALATTIGGGGSVAGYFDGATPTDPIHSIFYEPLIGGDSGNPMFLLYDGDAILCAALSDIAVSGWDIAVTSPNIESLIVDADTNAGVSTGYVPTRVDFSAFPALDPTFRPYIPGAGPPPVHLGAYQEGANLTTYVYTGVNFGPVEDRDYVVVGFIARRSGTGLDVASVTIGGVAGTLLASNPVDDGANSSVSAFYSAVVPSGTSGVVNVALNSGALRSSLDVWSIKGVTSITPYATDTYFLNNGTAAPSLAATLTGAASSVLVVAMTEVIGGAPTWTGVTRQSNRTVEFIQSSAGSDQLGAASLTVTISATGANGTKNALLIAIK